ncbi:MAG: leucine-rich repeat domain-containing protein, partial [Clostridia bacterium]|nr:leucine-rich repeat domain-containing protein [Clostridia bacterium]
MHRYSKKRYSLRRLAAVFALILMCATLMAPSAFAAEDSGKCGSLKWSYAGGVLTISGHGAMPDFSEPDMAPWYAHRANISRLELADGITSIGKLAFYDCAALVGADIPKKVKTIGDMAFAGCTSLESVWMPGVETLGEYAFSRCFALKSVNLPEGLRTIGYAAFYRCESLQSICVPAGVTEMGGSVFAYCAGLLEAKILCPMEMLPEWTFYGCERLQRVTLPAEMKGTGSSAFTRCEALSEVYHNGTEEDQKSLAEDITEDLKMFVPAQITSSPEAPPAVSQKTFEETEDGLSEIVTEITDTDHGTIQTETIVTRPIIGEMELGEEEQGQINVGASITDQKGWDALTETLEEQIFQQGLLKERTGKEVPLSAQIDLLDGSLLYGKTLEALAGKNITLYLRTPNGSRWSIDCSLLKGLSFQKSYDMDYMLTRYEKPSKAHKKVLGAAVSYWLKFEDRIDFPATVELYIDPTALRQVASLYENAFMSGLQRLQSVTVGQDGVAPYRMANVNKGKRYVVALNVSGVSADDVILSDQSVMDSDWLENYVPVTEQYTITDVRGFMGMTMKQFTITLVCVLAGLAFIIFILALVINMMGKKKALEEHRKMQ